MLQLVKEAAQIGVRDGPPPFADLSIRSASQSDERAYKVLCG